MVKHQFVNVGDYIINIKDIKYVEIQEKKLWFMKNNKDYYYVILTDNEYKNFYNLLVTEL
jgi:hypothetical protein